MVIRDHSDCMLTFGYFDIVLLFCTFLGEIEFNTDIVRQLRAHSKTAQSTYAYYYTNLYHAPPGKAWWDWPTWIKKSADHADELAMVWGVLLLGSDGYNTLAKGNPEHTLHINIFFI